MHVFLFARESTDTVQVTSLMLISEVRDIGGGLLMLKVRNDWPLECI